MGNRCWQRQSWPGRCCGAWRIAFLYADLIVLPILNIYRTYYGWRLAAYIAAVLFATMIVTGILVDLLFNGLDLLFRAAHFIPTANPHLVQNVTMFSFDSTAILNILALIAIGVLIYINYTRWNKPAPPFHSSRFSATMPLDTYCSQYIQGE